MTQEAVFSFFALLHAPAHAGMVWPDEFGTPKVGGAIIVIVLLVLFARK